jgi:hypothetical protein
LMEGPGGINNRMSKPYRGPISSPPASVAQAGSRIAALIPPLAGRGR